jgi:hypothetical protein
MQAFLAQGGHNDSSDEQHHEFEFDEAYLPPKVKDDKTQKQVTFS